MNFELISDYHPTGDQPEAIAQLVDGIRSGMSAQTLLGVTGSGKTFTIANVISPVKSSKYVNALWKERKIASTGDNIIPSKCTILFAFPGDAILKYNPTA